MTGAPSSSLFIDSSYLRSQQYKDSTNLDVRAGLHERFSTNRYGWHPWVFDHIELLSAERVLELGCGSGDLWRQSAGRVPGSWSLVVTDLSEGMVEATRAGWPEGTRHPAFGVIDAQGLPISDDSLDIVIANHILHHMADIPLVLREIRRVLRPGGVLIATAVGLGHMKELHEMVARFDPSVRRDRVLPWLSFVLETGSALLAENFEHTEVFRYPDALAVTEATPLVDYVASLISGEPAFSTIRQEFTEHVAQMISEQGAIHISKNSGLFRAW